MYKTRGENLKKIITFEPSHACRINNRIPLNNYILSFFFSLNLMSVVLVYISHSVFSFIDLTSVLLRTRSFQATSRYFKSVIMSNLSIESISSCEIAGSDYAFLKPNSPDISSTKSEVVCNFSFKEPIAGTSFIISGVIMRTCERFSINLLAVGKHQDVALHFNPRLPQNYIVRNSKISGKKNF